MVIVSTMSQLDLIRHSERCGNCGRNSQPTTVVIDFRPELMCDQCVARFDWSDWNFDPILNTYSR